MRVKEMMDTEPAYEAPDQELETDASGMLTFRTPIAKADEGGATDTNCTRITAIDSFDALGYRGCGGEEHSGENSPVEPEDLLDELADNRPSQIRGVGQSTPK